MNIKSARVRYRTQHIERRAMADRESINWSNVHQRRAHFHNVQRDEEQVGDGLRGPEELHDALVALRTGLHVHLQVAEHLHMRDTCERVIRSARRNAHDKSPNTYSESEYEYVRNK